MKKYLIYVVLLVLVVVNAQAQNILSNPSFKTKLNCPTTEGQIDFCKFWYNETDASPDFYHDCTDIHSIVHVPTNIAGYQTSPSNSYAGIFTYAEGFDNLREYIGTSFLPLTVGETYTVTISVSLAERVMYATQGLGIYFYVNGNMTPVAAQSLLAVTPQIDYTSYGLVSDRNNWVQLTKTFVADSAYTHLVIGNFQADANVAPTEVPSDSAFIFMSSYYYIDSVSVAGNVAWITNINGPGITKSEAISPNPFHTTATLRFENAGNKNFTVTLADMSGRIVRTYEAVSTNSLTIDRGDLPPGVYFYKVISEDAAYCGKVIIE